MTPACQARRRLEKNEDGTDERDRSPRSRTHGSLPCPANPPRHPLATGRCSPRSPCPNFRRYVSGQALSLIGTWVETVAQALLVLRLTHSGTVLGPDYRGAVRADPAAVPVCGPAGGPALQTARAARHADRARPGLGRARRGRADRRHPAVAGGRPGGAVRHLQRGGQPGAAGVRPGSGRPGPGPQRGDAEHHVGERGPGPGPTIAAVLASTVGLGWCFVVNAVSFGFVIVSLLSLDTRRLHPVPPVPRRRGQLRAGLRYAARVPEIARPLLMMALVGTFTFEFEVSLPLLAEKTFHGGATTYSWLIGALGAGAVAGGLYAARSARTGVAWLTRAALALRDRRRPGRGRAHLARPRWPPACSSAWPPSSFLTTGNCHHPARIRARVPRPGHRAVVDGPGRHHPDRLTDHRRDYPTSPGRGTRSPSGPPPASPPSSSAAGPPMAVAACPPAVTSIHAGVQGAQPFSIWPMPFADSSDFARNPAAGLSAISSA